MTTTATFTIAKRNGGVDELTDWDESRLSQGIKAHSAVHVRNVSFKLNPVTTNKVVAATDGVTIHPTLVCTVKYNGHATLQVLTEALEKAAMSHLRYGRFHVSHPAPQGIHP